MHNEQIIFGTWEEVTRHHASDLKGHRVEVRVLDEKAVPRPSRMITEGMFPQLAAVLDDDFRSAEWHGHKEVDA